MDEAEKIFSQVLQQDPGSAAALAGISRLHAILQLTNEGLTIEDHGTGLSRELDQIQARETRRFILDTASPVD